MKTIIYFVAAVMLVLCAGICFSAEEVKAEKENVSELSANELLVLHYEKTLIALNADVREIVTKVSFDNSVSAEEMKQVNQVVKKLNSTYFTAESALGEADFLKINISVLQDSISLKGITANYYNPILKKRDKDGTVQLNFAKISGKDIKIEGYFSYVKLVVFIILTLLGGFFFFLGIDNDGCQVGAIGFFMALGFLALIIAGLCGV